MLRRRELMADRVELPAGYRRCKYLGSNKKQYIDTNISFNKDYAYHIAVKFNTSKLNYMFGFAYVLPVMYLGVENTVFTAYGDKNMNGIRPNYTGNIVHFVLKNGFQSIDGAVVSNHTASKNNVCTPYLFTMNNSDMESGKGRIYNYKVESSDDIIQNFIPCLSKTGKPCMYDTVSKQPFYNLGTGEFGYELMDGTYVDPI